MKLWASKGALTRIRTQVQQMQNAYAALSPEARREHDQALEAALEKVRDLAERRRRYRGIEPKVLHQKCDC